MKLTLTPFSGQRLRSTPALRSERACSISLEERSLFTIIAPFNILLVMKLMKLMKIVLKVVALSETGWKRT
jgi:hypothetical protein